MLKRIKESIIRKNKALFSTTDLHSHLIPEIDDGCSSMQESITIIREMKKLGYKKLVVSPHIMIKKYPNSTKIIKQGLFELRSILKVENINIEIEAIAEYYCDKYFEELIKKNDLLSFGDKYILFELPYTTRPKNLDFVIHELKRKGFKPVLAHPERYRFINEIREYRILKKSGLFFQVNINSLGGYYGKEAQKKSLMLGQKSMIDFVGSDMHHKKHLDSLKENLISNNLEMVFRNNKILNDNI